MAQGDTAATALGPCIVRGLTSSSLLAVIAFTVLASVPVPARSCAPILCREPPMTLARGAVVPANATGIVWTAPQAAEDVRLSQEGAGPVGTQVSANGKYPRVVPTTPWREGQTYSYGWAGKENGCEEPEQVEFTVGAAAPVPDSLGVLSVGAPYLDAVSLADGSSVCSSPYEVVRVDVSLERSEALAPWWDSMVVELWVDGAPWKYTSPNSDFPFGRVRPLAAEPVLSYCGTTDASTGHPQLAMPEEGTHEIQFVGYLPDGSEVRSSAETISLVCAEAGPEQGCAVAHGPNRGSSWLPWLCVAALWQLFIPRRTNRALR